MVVIFPLAGPGDSYCAWDLEGLDWHCGPFYGTTDSTLGHVHAGLSMTKGRTESNLQLHCSAHEPNKPFSLATKILTMKKSPVSSQRDIGNSWLPYGVLSSARADIKIK